MSLITRHFKMLKFTFPLLQHPSIVLAPMRHYSGPEAALVVTSAGGIGFMNPQMTKEALFKDLETTRELLKTDKYSNLKSADSKLPVGLGFLLWAVQLSDAIEAVEKYRPAAVWLYGGHGGQKELDEWSTKLREANPAVKVWVMIGTLQEAKELVASPSPPDVIVVQGSEAGGHGRATDGSSWTTLLPEVAEVVQGSIPLFVAGGIVDGRGVAAALAMGASGVVMGTRFLASEEIRISKGYREHVLKAEDGAKSTTKTLLWNHLNGVYGWPKWLMPRGIINRSFTDQQAGVSFDELQRLHDEKKKEGDAAWGDDGRTATYAGMGVGLVKEVKPAAAIVEEVRAEALTIMRDLADVNSKL
ncbi:Nitronate monooxygenase [Pseudocercospora fuligena]|uniref:Nitronate monooxygenase n=1 Tax=Pseudocercospora fuligena TaxID=685502 RepID=A0A8H6R8W3_9PEZI|nr:Nitronate monooxygenase [Pseudocercospora fuligena]